MTNTVSVYPYKIVFFLKTVTNNWGDSLRNIFLFPHLNFSFFFLSLPTSHAQFEEMNSELEENKELAENRLIELQKLQQDLQNVHQDNQSMRVSWQAGTGVTVHETRAFVFSLQMD